MEKSSISKATLGRLPVYLNCLKKLPKGKDDYISATLIAKTLGLGEVQVRKDLAAVSGSGKPKRGYLTEELITKLEECLGTNKIASAVIVGAGKLGTALLQYDEFEKYGVRISAAFDREAQTAHFDSKIEVLPMSQFEEFCKKQHVKLGIITVGEDSAQDVCNRMVESGINAIWNFAPCKLNVPENVLLKNENLALSLAHLNNQLCSWN